MFAALCENGDFFRDKMKCFIAIAPVLKINNLSSPRLQKLKNDKIAYETLKALGPEIMTMASAGDPIKQAVTGSFLGEAVSQIVMRDISDSDPFLISKTGWNNFSKFYPAGSSFQTISHFHQLLLTGEFRKFTYDYVKDNLEAYGQGTEKPPLYNTDNIAGFKISLVCGKGDLLASKMDYDYVRELLSVNNEVVYQEFEEGHMGLLFPKSYNTTK